MELLIVVLLVVLIMTTITIYYKLYNQYIRLYNNYEQTCIDEHASIKRDYKCIIDILEKHKLDLTALLDCATSYSEITNQFKTSLLSISRGILELHQEHNQVVQETIRRDFSLNETVLNNIKDINTAIDKLNKSVNNLQLDINNNNKYYSIYDNKLDDVILNNHINRDNIELISFNIDKLIKSLEAKNSLCKCKSTKTSTKKKKEETQADNS